MGGLLRMPRSDRRPRDANVQMVPDPFWTLGLQSSSAVVEHEQLVRMVPRDQQVLMAQQEVLVQLVQLEHRVQLDRQD